VLLYGVEAWTFKKKHIDKLQACGTDIISNTKVLNQMQKKCKVINTIKVKKASIPG